VRQGSDRLASRQLCVHRRLWARQRCQLLGIHYFLVPRSHCLREDAIDWAFFRLRLFFALFSLRVAFRDRVENLTNLRALILYLRPLCARYRWYCPCVFLLGNVVSGLAAKRPLLSFFNALIHSLTLL
jgi:hypothetical protein